MNMYKNIRDLREDKDLTQQELANILRITQATYSRYESGELDIPTAVLNSQIFTERMGME
ncbi:Helix-turn-helix domain-containing protein [Paenibacillus sophorae]|uniref:Helix-turn-helix domain-containing protein n=2 Tax=Paenibacillus sophorae TaxID=1333845 RepID=A0A1H8QXT0_9BACL|nr:Helix-turn-helix domain-containing protein [Paenibacillus sophorae]